MESECKGGEDAAEGEVASGAEFGGRPQLEAPVLQSVVVARFSTREVLDGAPRRVKEIMLVMLFMRLMLCVLFMLVMCIMFMLCVLFMPVRCCLFFSVFLVLFVMLGAVVRVGVVLVLVIVSVVIVIGGCVVVAPVCGNGLGRIQLTPFRRETNTNWRAGGTEDGEGKKWWECVTRVGRTPLLPMRETLERVEESEEFADGHVGCGADRVDEAVEVAQGTGGRDDMHLRVGGEVADHVDGCFVRLAFHCLLYTSPSPRDY